MKKLIALIATVITVTFSCSKVEAQASVHSCNVNQKILIENVITEQINALTKSDWKSAYSYSALSFQKAVPLEVFKETIKSQYVFLVFNDGFGFGSCKVTKSGFNQVVTVDYHGVKHILSYDLTLVDKRLGVVAANEVKTTVGLAA